MKLHKNKSDRDIILNQSAKKSVKKLILHFYNFLIMTTKDSTQYILGTV